MRGDEMRVSGRLAYLVVPGASGRVRLGPVILCKDCSLLVSGKNEQCRPDMVMSAV